MSLMEKKIKCEQRRSGKNVDIENKAYELLKFCFDHNFLSFKQALDWVYINCEYQTKNSARLARYRMLKYLENKKYIEIRQDVYNVKKRNFFIKTRGVEALKERGIFTYSETKYPFKNRTHNQYVTDVRLKWQSEYPISDISTEKQNWYRFKDKAPDLGFKAAAGADKQEFSFAHEIELHPKSQNRYYKIFQFYHDSEFKGVFYYVADERIKDILLSIAPDLTNKVLVCYLHEFLDKGLKTVCYAKNNTYTLNQIFLNSNS